MSAARAASARRPPGRPKATRFTRELAVRLTEADVKALTKLADNLGIGASTLIRWLVRDALAGRYTPAPIRPFQGAARAAAGGRGGSALAKTEDDPENTFDPADL